MSFEAPTPEPEEYDPENFSNITLTEQELAEFALVRDQIWAKIREEINTSLRK